MDFLSIRKKARERAEAKEASQPAAKPAGEGAPSPVAEPTPAPAPAAAPAPVAVQPAGAPASESPPSGERRRTRRDDPILTEAELQDGTLEARFQGLAPSSDGRFATWRPGFGPPPLEPDHRSYAAPRRSDPDPGPESERPVVPEPLPDPEPVRSVPSATEPVLARGRSPVAADPLDLFFYRPDEEAAVVPALGGGLNEEPGLQPPEILDEYLTFLLGKEEYAVAIERVREVLRAPAITEVPRAPAHVLGVVTVRGEVVAVVDARGRLGLGGGESASGRIVIVDAGEGPLGLLVDAVTSVVRLPRGSIEPCPQGMSAGAADCVTGIGRHRDQLFMVIDAAALLPRSTRP
jgi:purine-binding chemotaxis protein CheW